MSVVEVSLQTIWDAIERNKRELMTHSDTKFESIHSGLDKIQCSLSSLGDHVSELEQRVSSNEDNLEGLTKRVLSLEKENAYLKDKADEAENRSRSSNLRFLNVPEQSEGRDMMAFLNQLIPQLLGKENFSAAPIIERAHRSPSFSSSSRSSPRPILAKFLLFQDKVRILRLSREKGELTFQGARIHIYPDFSVALINKRRQFDTVKKKLRDADIRYSLRYPCTLRVIVDGKPKFFRSADEAETFFSDSTTDRSMDSTGPSP